MKISRTLAAAALSGALVLGGTTAAIAQIPEGADSTVVSLPASIEVDGVTFYKDTTVDEGKGDYKSADGTQTLPYLAVKVIVESRQAAEDKESESSSSEETTEPTDTTSKKTTEPTDTTSKKTTEPKASESASATKSSAASSSASTTKSSDASSSASTTKSSDSSESATTTESTDASVTTTPSSSKSAEPTPTNEPGDKKSSARDALSSKDGKPTPLAIFGIVAGVLAAVAAAFPVIAKTLNLNIKLPF